MSLRLSSAILLFAASVISAQEARIIVRPNVVLSHPSRHMTGVCIEDVNHEIYGGLYSQMIYGESFQEPAPPSPLKGFTAFGADWSVQDGVLSLKAGDGPKLALDRAAFAVGEVGMEIMLPEGSREGNAGLVVKLQNPGIGADRFTGYEVALESGRNILILGRHRNNWEPIQTVPCDVPVNQWIPVVAKVTQDSLEVVVKGKSIIKYQDREHPLAAGSIALRTWRRDARYRNLWLKVDGKIVSVPFEPTEARPDAVSGMWREIRRGSVVGAINVDTKAPFIGCRSQRITLESGDGELGVENQGLNRWGMNFVADKSYEGCLCIRSEKPSEVFVALESADGSKIYAERKLDIPAGDWHRLDFTLTPHASDTKGRFAIKLRKPASVSIGYAFLQPGEWARFKGLPIRKDIADMLIAQGVTVMRYGGCMANAAEYRWKKMLGPRDRRPPYKGWWYDYASNGWGIIDFLDFCEAAGFLAIPDFNMDETPQDMADFIEYATGSPDTPWGLRRAEAGHPTPYDLHFVQLGNEESVDETYWKKFEPLAKAIWAKDPRVILVVGDFEYKLPITDPFNFTGAPRIKTLAAHKKILDLARQHDREVWFDVHVWTEQPQGPEGLGGIPSFIKALEKLSPGARFNIAIFELNANIHSMRRALSNAHAINEAERLADKIRIVCSANGLQPYRQNDNGWNQGLVFLSPSQVWTQPPCSIMQMLSRHYLPTCVKADDAGASSLDVTAKTSEDGKLVQLQVVNMHPQPVPTDIAVEGFVPTKPNATVVELSAGLDDVNTLDEPHRVTPRTTQWPHRFANGHTTYTFPPHSFTILRLE